MTALTAYDGAGALAGEEPVRWRGCGGGAQVRHLTGRAVRIQVLDAHLLLFCLLDPLLMLVVFSQVFGGLAHAPGFPEGVRYIDFLLPGLLVTTAIQVGLQTATGLIEDMRNGIITRFRSLPIRMGSVLIAHSLAALIRGVLRLVLLLVLAFAVFGYRPAGGVPGAVAAAVLSLVLGWSLGWIFIALACRLRRPETMQAASGLVMFPLMFASNAFTPLDGMPAWLGAAARLNPMSHGIDAARALSLGRPAGSGALLAVSVALAVAAVAAPLAVRGLRDTSR
ncbi:ABC transporter permease [Thermomonospora umbrina]|uniref:Transport permease protein n=1 Tax=Thermomonospora umbrina TaxID=111806 RepID=A0A3D9SM44_9ACTN|nr:ABC transporter permease [Thermomonospora umbrina]REE96918.1 ABC-2 type transport system permease protein [Thermomonospora umbrina]